MAALAFALAGCAATGLGVECPGDFVAVNGTCVCADDNGCPAGHTCRNGICICNSNLCCPAGYQFDPTGQQCVCNADSCCPSGYRFDPTSAQCACNDPSCCPVGFAFNALAGTCTCDGTDCCPQGFYFAQDAGLPLDDGGWERIVLDGGELGVCACDSDDCCPIDYRWDVGRTACVCAQSSCCPANYTYDPAAFGCVCNGDACCPKGYVEDQAAGHCVCASDATCGPGQVCSQDAGRCICVSNAGCPQGQFCNGLGFCQTLSGCVSNADCPAGTFCDSITSRCLPVGDGGFCTQDANCTMGSICDVAVNQCQSGCRTTDDCPLQQSCSGGACVNVCLNNQFCPPGQDCDTSTGTCFMDPNTDYCAPCGNSQQCTNSGVDGISDQCLQFIIEGQEELFCGVACNTSADCASDYTCGVSLQNCAGPNDPSCGQAAAGSYCQEYMVVNESTPLFLCANPATGQPMQFQSFCAPLSGTCNCNSFTGGCLPEPPCLNDEGSCPPDGG